jgi:glycerol kinase
VISQYLLGIDQGTSSSRAIIFDAQGQRVATAQHEFDQIFPKQAWVEQNPEDVWQTVLTSCQEVMAQQQLCAADIAAIGISNQRETSVIWDKHTGQPIYNAIGWQDGRTAALCQQMVAVGHGDMVQEKTGLLLNPYFCAAKVKWLLDNVDGAREKAAQGDLLFGTIDCFLLWRLTGGLQHKTDATNASRTLLFNIHTQQWDDELLALFDIPRQLLPDVLDNCADFGSTQADLFGGEIAITAMVGDQQAALVGQACFLPGMMKSTYGTGAFIVGNTGDKAVPANSQLLTTVAYRLQDKTTYAVEGSIFVAGAGVKWLRDELQIIGHANETEAMAKAARQDSELYFVPCFTGLGAPYWQPNARAMLSGLTLESGRNEIVRALLEGCCYCTKDVMQAITAQSELGLDALHVDGAMVANDWLLQFLADILNVQIKRPQIIETSALGAAYFAGLQIGLFESLEHIASLWQAQKTFTPTMQAEQRAKLYAGWNQAIARALVP